MNIPAKDTHFEWINIFKETSKTLLDYGWFITPYMTGGEVASVRGYCEKISEGVITDKIQIKRELNVLFEDVIFHPNFRAFYVYRALHLPHVKNFSHFLEKAIFHYYKSDYFSCVACLVPAVEGIILSHCDYSFDRGDRRPGQKNIFDLLEAKVNEGYFSERYQMYKETILVYLRKWFFSDTSNFDWESSSLNRHSFTHGMQVNHFYSIEECHRLFLFFDLYIELLGIENGERVCLIPTDKEPLNRRREYYFNLLIKEISLQKIIDTEERLLSEHLNYKSETNRPRLEDSFNKMFEPLLNLKVVEK